MDPILQVLLSWQFVLFSLAIATIVHVICIIAQYVAESFHKNMDDFRFWREIFLPLFPIALGVLSSLLLKKFPYPGFTPDANGVILRGDRITFGLAAGLLSTLLYQVIKALLTQKLQGISGSLQINVGTPTTTPTPVAPVVVAPISPEDLPPRAQS